MFIFKNLRHPPPPPVKYPKNEKINELSGEEEKFSTQIWFEEEKKN